MNAADRSSLQERLVLSQVDRYRLVFPAPWVAEISRFQRSHILHLPFYQPPLLGLMHQNGHVISLVSAAELLQVRAATSGESATVIRLSENAGSLAQVGIVVDKVTGSTTRAEMPESVLESTDAPPTLGPGATVILRQEWFSEQIWQPQRWSAKR
ncbi:MAG: chemotaxis protein CheW [Cyanobacteria bacterium P01_F01_bin.42]